MLLFLICQVFGGFSLRPILLAERRHITSQSPGVFCSRLFLLELLFSHKNINSSVSNHYYNCYPPPPQLNHKIKFYHIYEVNELEEEVLNKDWVCVRSEGKG